MNLPSVLAVECEGNGSRFEICGLICRLIAGRVGVREEWLPHERGGPDYTQALCAASFTAGRYFA
jgi:hypothetical protein